jgi:hypothetical protein
MLRIVKICLLFCFLACPAIMPAQGSSKETESQVASTTSGSLAQKREARKKWKADRKKRHDSEKSLKDYKKRTQDKPTRKRMKESRKRAEMNNEHKREFFLKRWFKKRIKTTKKKER